MFSWANETCFGRKEGLAKTYLKEGVQMVRILLFTFLMVKI
jgi:hypothetical protein